MSTALFLKPLEEDWNGELEEKKVCNMLINDIYNI